MAQTATTRTTHGSQLPTECEADVEGVCSFDDGPGSVLTSADDSGASAGDSSELRADGAGAEVVTGKEL
jgi:hypothetical protein